MSQKYVTKSLRITPELAESVAATATERGVPEADVLREAVERGLSAGMRSVVAQESPERPQVLLSALEALAHEAARSRTLLAGLDERILTFERRVRHSVEAILISLSIGRSVTPEAAKTLAEELFTE